jgi:hypothetical protein
VASIGGVTLLPLYMKHMIPSVVARPLYGEVPTINLIMGYNKSNTSPLLKRFLSLADELVSRVSQTKVHSDVLRPPRLPPIQGIHRPAAPPSDFAPVIHTRTYVDWKAIFPEPCAHRTVRRATNERCSIAHHSRHGRLRLVQSRSMSEAETTSFQQLVRDGVLWRGEPGRTQVQGSVPIRCQPQHGGTARVWYRGARLRRPAPGEGRNERHLLRISCTSEAVPFRGRGPQRTQRVPRF